MALLKDLDDFDRNAVIGDWAFLNDDELIAIMLYEGMGGVVILSIKPNPDRIHWQWDGNRESPTLSPSILVWGNGREKPATWHGFLRAGKLEGAS